MAITWSLAAEDSLFEILNYYELQVGLDFAESIENRIYAQIEKLEGFLNIQDRSILQGAGKVSADLAKQLAETEFEKFKVLDDARFESDFDKMYLGLNRIK